MTQIIKSILSTIFYFLFPSAEREDYIVFYFKFKSTFIFNEVKGQLHPVYFKTTNFTSIEFIQTCVENYVKRIYDLKDFNVKVLFKTISLSPLKDMNFSIAIVDIDEPTFQILGNKFNMVPKGIGSLNMISDSNFFIYLLTSISKEGSEVISRL